MKRWGRVTLGLLLAGAFINTAVAWALGYWWYDYRDDGSGWYPAYEGEYWVIVRERGLGSARVCAYSMPKQMLDIMSSSFPTSMPKVDDPIEALPGGAECDRSCVSAVCR